MLNVLMVSYIVDKDDVSEAQMAYKWISELSKHVKIWLVTTGSRKHDTCGLEGRENVHLEIIEPRISFKKMDVIDRAIHPGYIEFSLRAKKVISRIIQTESIDICHHLAPQSVRFSTPLCDMGIPYVIGPVHGGMHPPKVMHELQGREPWIFQLRKLDFLRKKIDWRLARTWTKARNIVVSAPYIKDVLGDTYTQKYEIISGTAVELLPKASRSNRENVQFVFSGRIVPSKGIELLIHALPHCRNKNFTVEIYGQGYLQDYCKTLAEDLHVSHYIHWHGFMPLEDVISGYQKADVFILPSLKEPAGISVLEAMSVGLPVICVDAGGPAYSVADDCGIKVPLATKDEMITAIASAIDKMIEDDELREKMGQNGRRRIEDMFTWEVVAQQMLLLYNKILRNKTD